MEDNNILGVVLAGGKSKDLVKIKINIKLGNKTLLEHVLSKINNKFKKLNCLKPSIEIQTTKKLTIIQDCFENFGPLGGVLSAMKWIKENQKTYQMDCNISIRYTFF